MTYEWLVYNEKELVYSARGLIYSERVKMACKWVNLECKFFNTLAREPPIEKEERTLCPERSFLKKIVYP